MALKYKRGTTSAVITTLYTCPANTVAKVTLSMAGTGTRSIKAYNCNASTGIPGGQLDNNFIYNDEGKTGYDFTGSTTSTTPGVGDYYIQTMWLVPGDYIATGAASVTSYGLTIVEVAATSA